MGVLPGAGVSIERPQTSAHIAPPILPGQPHDIDGQVFAAPWEARAFAMAVALHQRGLFTWTEWATTLSMQIGAAEADRDADGTYYEHWLNALEQIVADKGASTRGELASYRQAWDSAADRTAHGQPIELQPVDFTDP